MPFLVLSFFNSHHGFILVLDVAGLYRHCSIVGMRVYFLFSASKDLRPRGIQICNPLVIHVSSTKTIPLR